MAKKTNSSGAISGKPKVQPAGNDVVNPDAPSVDTTTPESNASSAPVDARERIAARAYERYLQRGGAHGRETEDWLEAEREIIGVANKAGSSSER